MLKCLNSSPTASRMTAAASGSFSTASRCSYQPIASASSVSDAHSRAKVRVAAGSSSGGSWYWSKPICSPVDDRGDDTRYPVGQPRKLGREACSGIIAQWPPMSSAAPSLADRLDRVPTAPIAAAGLIAGFGVASPPGRARSAASCWPPAGWPASPCGLRRDGPRVTVTLTATGLVAFALSHVLGRVIGAWPSVIVVSAVTAALCWRLSDARRPRRRARSRPSRSR